MSYLKKEYISLFNRREVRIERTNKLNSIHPVWDRNKEINPNMFLDNYKDMERGDILNDHIMNLFPPEKVETKRIPGRKPTEDENPIEFEVFCLVNTINAIFSEMGYRYLNYVEGECWPLEASQGEEGDLVLSRRSGLCPSCEENLESDHMKIHKCRCHKWIDLIIGLENRLHSTIRTVIRSDYQIKQLKLEIEKLNKTLNGNFCKGCNQHGDPSDGSCGCYLVKHCGDFSSFIDDNTCMEMWKCCKCGYIDEGNFPKSSYCDCGDTIK